MRAARLPLLAVPALLVLGACSGGGSGRTLSVEARDYSYRGLDKFTAKAGTEVSLEMKNTGRADHELVIIDPGGATIGGVPPTPPGRVGAAKVALGQAGTYTYGCFVEDHLSRGMTGTFVVK